MAFQDKWGYYLVESTEETQAELSAPDDYPRILHHQMRLAPKQ